MGSAGTVITCLNKQSLHRTALYNKHILVYNKHILVYNKPAVRLWTLNAVAKTAGTKTFQTGNMRTR